MLHGNVDTAPRTNWPAIFAEADIICTMSRAQLIADGDLIDVSHVAKEAGFVFPVAITAALHGDLEDIPEAAQGIQSYEGRLWDVLWMLRCAIQGAIPKKGNDQQFLYDLILHVGEQPAEGEGDVANYTVKAVCGPGDNAEPVITLLKPEED